jgi:hypothetical protein
MAEAGNTDPASLARRLNLTIPACSIPGFDPLLVLPLDGGVGPLCWH